MTLFPPSFLHNFCSAAWVRYKLQLSCSRQTYRWSFIGNEMVITFLISSLHCCTDDISMLNISTSPIYLNMCLICFLSFICRWPSSLVLQGSGLQPALKSVRVSKAMSALHSFVELLKGKFMLLLPFVKLVHVNFHLSSCIWLFRFVYTDTLKMQYISYFFCCYYW